MNSVAQKKSKWVKKTLTSVGLYVNNPLDIQRTRSQKIRANFSLMSRVMEHNDPQAFGEDKGNPLWETTMDNEYNTGKQLHKGVGELVPFP